MRQLQSYASCLLVAVAYLVVAAAFWIGVVKLVLWLLGLL
jgi:hypothetical protein